MNEENNISSQPITPSPSPAPVPAPEPEKKDGFFSEMFKFTLFALLVVLPIRMFVAQPYIVSGVSMDTTFADGEYIIVDQISYKFEDPHRGDVIIFKYPKDETKNFIKRVIGLPGETVTIEGTTVTIKNKDYPLGFKLQEPYINSRNEKEENMSVTLRPGQYFVMGDNRRQSSDSRAWGTLPRTNIIGRPLVRLFPFTRIDLLPGSYKETK
jgi:signal peptidase I